MLALKNVIVTGGNQGFGFEIAKKMVSEGANVCICARDENKMTQAVHKLEEQKKSEEQKIRYILTDIGEIKQIEGLFNFAQSEFGSIDVVVNNAGIYGPFGSIDTLQWEDWETAVRINLLGTIYSMRKAIEVMKRQGHGGKIVNLSGGGATAPMPYISSYAATKSAVVRMTETVAKEVYNDRIYINAIAPGALNTRLLDQVIAAGTEMVGEEFYQKALKQKETGGASLERAAELVAYLADDISDGISGKLISAVWDDWEHLHEHKDEIMKSDIYTLRRIVK